MPAVRPVLRRWSAPERRSGPQHHARTRPALRLRTRSLPGHHVVHTPGPSRPRRPPPPAGACVSVPPSHSSESADDHRVARAPRADDVVERQCGLGRRCQKTAMPEDSDARRQRCQKTAMPEDGAAPATSRIPARGPVARSRSRAAVARPHNRVNSPGEVHLGTEADAEGLPGMTNALRLPPSLRRSPLERSALNESQQADRRVTTMSRTARDPPPDNRTAKDLESSLMRVPAATTSATGCLRSQLPPEPGGH
jgi:hypothetical protein